jgi:hypothetical protein
LNFWTNVLLVKCCLGKCRNKQMSYGQMSLGKCLWTDVEWANVIKPNSYMCVLTGKPERQYPNKLVPLVRSYIAANMRRNNKN